VCEREREEASSLKRDNMTREIAFFMPSWAEIIWRSEWLVK
jgi:hypothetical protein